jgi:two-component system NtrC family sensor kinase
VHASPPLKSESAAQYAIRVLLVDDQPMIGEAIRRTLLGQPKCEFHYCGDPLQAVRVAEEFKPTVILQDLVMPGVDGLALLKDYRAHEVLADVPTIVLSTTEDPAVKSTAFSIGASDYLIKLPDPVELIARIRHHSKAYLNQLQRDAAYRERTAAQEEVLRLAMQQQQLEEMVAQRLDSVGQLAAGIAHEINTPVQYITDNMNFIGESVKELIDQIERSNTKDHTADTEFLYLKENLPSALVRSVEGLARIASIVKSLKDFSRPDSTDMSPCDLNEEVTSTLEVAQTQYARIAELNTHLGELPPVICYAAEFRQAVLNLLNNAAEAMSAVFKATNRRGLLTVSTRRENDHALIEIADTGNGIRADIRPKVFDPFFTTKEVGTGMGQGLTIARNIIVRKHRGALTFESVEGSGTTFFIRLPIDPRVNPKALNSGVSS